MVLGPVRDTRYEGTWTTDTSWGGREEDGEG